MNVMKPMLVWVEGACFRFPDSDIWIPKDNATVPEVTETDLKKCDHFEETQHQDIIKSDVNGMYTHWYYVARRYHPFIVGVKRKMLEQIEKVTNTTICVPKTFESHDIVIKGLNGAAIAAAIDRINRIIDQARTIIDPTHFLSISITDETIQSNFVKFRDDVLNEYKSHSRGINKPVFEIPEKLHINLGMLLLVDDDEMKTVLEALAEWKKTMITPFIEKNGPIKIKIEELDHVQEVHSLNSVVYAKVSSENNTLQAFADRTEQFFVEKGLMIVPKNRMKLHMKLMSFPSPAGKKMSCKSAEKSCRDLVTTHKDRFFGVTVLNSFYLSQRHTYDETQYYATVEKIDLQVV